MRDVLGLPCVDERAAGAHMLEHLELTDGLHPARQLQRLDQPPRGVDDEQPRLTGDRARQARDRVATSETLGRLIVRH